MASELLATQETFWHLSTGPMSSADTIFSSLYGDGSEGGWESAASADCPAQSGIRSGFCSTHTGQNPTLQRASGVREDCWGDWSDRMTQSGDLKKIMFSFLL